MIGQTIQSSSRFPWGSVLWFLVGLGLVLLGFGQHNVHWAIGGVFPLLVGLALWWVRPRAFAAHFTENSLEVMEPRLSIPYEHLESVRPEGRASDPEKKGPRFFPMEVLAAEGVVNIPARINVPSLGVYRFLLGLLSEGGSREVNPLLADYLARQEETFGSEKVWSYRARSFLGGRRRGRKGPAVSLAVAASGIAWMVAGFQGKGFEGWLGAGILFLLFGSLFLLLFRLPGGRGQARIKNWRDASLVISPLGLAIIQGDLKGELRWEELRNLHMKVPKFVTYATRAELGPGIRLVVEGATIVIADVYDRPLRVIYQRIQDYWRP